MTMTTTAPETTITASDEVPTISISREFDAPRELVFRAWTDPELVPQWLGPDDIATEIVRWECRRGGEWAYINTRIGGEQDFEAGFYGSFHEVREPELLVQTFTWEGWPDGVSLERMVFEELPGGRCRVSATSLFDSFEARDGMLSSGMDKGVTEGYAKLDRLLQRLG